jgi:hypothetical protein
METFGVRRLIAAFGLRKKAVMNRRTPKGKAAMNRRTPKGFRNVPRVLQK